MKQSLSTAVLAAGAMAAAWAGFFAGTGTAAAHVVLKERQAPAGSYHTAELIVPHGCEDAPTLAIRVLLPDGLTGVKPRPKPGWTLSIARGPRPEPVRDAHGTEHTEGVREIAWHGGNLPDSQFDRFAVMMRLPEAPEGTVLHFPVVQTCAGAERRWSEVPESGGHAHDLESPAPALRLTAPE